MRQLLHALSIATVFGCSIFNQSGFAQDKTVPKVMTSVQSEDTVLFSRLAPLTKADGTKSDAVEPDVVHPQPDAPAPPLTRVFINNVCSDSAGTQCETISSSETQTVNTYHGANVYVFVWEIGYGTGEIATQGGAQISSANLVGRVGVCTSGNSYTTNCPAGTTYVGFRYEWNAGYYLNQGYGQNFTAQDTSSVSPYNTYSARLNILYSH